jgi:hypothetical protein
VGNVVSHLEGGTWAEVFEKMVLRGIFWPTRDDGTGKWNKLHNRMGERRSACMVFVRNPEGQNHF